MSTKKTPLNANKADLEGIEVFELGNGHFLILICQNRKQHRQKLKIMFLQREGSTLKIELRRVASSQMFEENR